MSNLLTPGGVAKLLQPKDPSQPRNTGETIVVQAIHIKSISSPQSKRFRIVISDGQHYVQSMMSAQMNALVAEGTLQEFGLLAIQDHMFNDIQGKTIVIVLNAHVLSEQPGHKIGTPTPFAGATTTNAAPVPAQPLYNSTNNNPTSHTATAYDAKPSHTATTTSTATAMTVSPPRSSPSAKNPYGRPSSSTSSSSPVAPIVRSNNTTSMNYTKISELNLYHSRWTIQARVTSKSDIRTWSNAKGEGSLFSISLLDESGTDIRATFFKEAVDRFYGMLQEGRVYTFSGGRLKVANARWNTCKSPHEITFDQNSEIHMSHDNSNIQTHAYDFVESIASIESMMVDPEKHTHVDVLAYVHAISDPVTLLSKKKGQEFTKCDVTLMDDSQAQINLTLWNDQVQKASSLMPLNELVGVCRSRLSDYGGGKSLSSFDTVVLAKNEAGIQKLPAYHRLQAWYQETGGQGPAKSLSSSGGSGFGGPASFAERKEIADIKREQLGYQSEKGDYISFPGTVTFLKKDKEGGAWYPACPKSEDPCRNRVKVTPTTSVSGHGEAWHCERCQETFDHCIRRWIFSAVVEDKSSSTWVTFFNETAETLLGQQTADQVYTASDGHAPSDAYDSAFASAAFTDWIFKCKVKKELVNEELRVKTQVTAMHPVDYVQDSMDLLTAIGKF